jgi:hypothetical protein
MGHRKTLAIKSVCISKYMFMKGVNRTTLQNSKLAREDNVVVDKLCLGQFLQGLSNPQSHK